MDLRSNETWERAFISWNYVPGSLNNEIALQSEIQVGFSCPNKQKTYLIACNKV